jgi:SAM-dependent methyltransferase
MNISNCPVCAGDKTGLYNSYEFIFSQTGVSFHLAKCLTCGIVFTDPVPGTDLLNKIYGNDSYYSYLPYSAPPVPDRSGLMGRLKGWAKSTVLDHYYGCGKRKGDYKSSRVLWLAGWLLKCLVREDVVVLGRIIEYGKGGVHLDIGCGNGSYVWWMAKQGWQSRGIEINHHAVESARKIGLNVTKITLEGAKFPNASFDLVTAWDVMEHLPTLVDQLKTIHRILKPGGKLIGGVPNAGSWEAQLFGKNWQPWEIPSHLYHFTPTSLKEIIGLAGFELIKFKFLPFTHSWDASCDSLNRKSQLTTFILRPFGRPFYLLANLFGRGARMRFEAIAR